MLKKMLKKVTCSKYHKNLIILLIQYTFISNFVEKAQAITGT